MTPTNEIANRKAAVAAGANGWPVIATIATNPWKEV